MLIIAIVLFVIIDCLIVAVLLQPSAFTITRSATIHAPASIIFPHVNHLRSWNAWSPWARLDPNCITTFEGHAEGVGAVMRWEGNKKVGKGCMTITESVENESVALKMEFEKPMVATNQAIFTFTPDSADRTTVTWSMSGKNGFIAKAFSLILNCDKMVGGKFEQGLQNLRSITEAEAHHRLNG
jgi:Polyketide cyclase / dehydrase and lipid transport